MSSSLSPPTMDEKDHKLTSATPTVVDDSGSTKENEATGRAVSAEVHRSSTPAATTTNDEDRYLTGVKLALVFIGFLLSVFLFALDQTIVATAQPKIVSHFNALEKIAWISSAYFLTNAGLILTVGQILTIASTKWTYIVSIGLFELGSLFCAVAPNIDFLIFGRAVAGAGGAGIFTSVLAIIAEVTRLEDRPLLLGSFGAVFAVASAVGPLLGGAFTDHVSWRWCFYINLPFGALAILSVVLFLNDSGRNKTEEIKRLSLIEKWKRVDYIGTALALAFVTTLLLALQWGGNTKPWSDKDVIACLVVAGVLLILFCIFEYWMGDAAMLPFELLKRRTQVGASAEAFFLFLTLLIGTYYLPLWYQAKGASASKSGVDILPYMLSTVVGVGIAGGVTNSTGRYWPWLFGPPLIASVGAGLLYTITPETHNSKVIGFQILFGLGVGAGLQMGLIAIQTEYAREEHLIPQGTAVLNFIQIIGGVIGITVGGAVFANQLATALPTFAPGLTHDQMNAVRSSVTAISTLPQELQHGVIEAYSHSLDRVFIIGVATGGLAALTAFISRNYNIKERSPTAGGKTIEPAV